MKISLVVFFLIFTTACSGFKASLASFTPKNTTPSIPVPVRPSTEATLQQMVDSYNSMRTAEGQEEVSKGLSCSLYSVPTTTVAIRGAKLNFVGSFTYYGVFNQNYSPTSDGLDVLPAGLRYVYQNWYVLKCTGLMFVTSSAWHEFSLTSDDGSLLYIDEEIINNDGLHSAQTAYASKFLSYGVHKFELDYFQAGGMQTLLLKKDGQVMPTYNLYH